MAEFQEVMKQRERMCEIFDCADCPLSRNNNGTSCMLCNEFIRDCPAEAEAVIMKWASENPEPVYPSWEDAWKQLFPNACYVTQGVDKSPCPNFFVQEHCHTAYPYGCGDCRKQPIPADIAKKLGIKPINQ